MYGTKLDLIPALAHSTSALINMRAFFASSVLSRIEYRICPDGGRLTSWSGRSYNAKIKKVRGLAVGLLHVASAGLTRLAISAPFSRSTVPISY